MKLEILQADLANPQHADAIRRLVDEYARLPGGQGAPLAESVLAEMVPGLRKHPALLVFLAWSEGRAVGVAVCFVGFSTFMGKPLINIHDLAVTAACRGQGIGRRLLEAVEARARQMGCGKITLEVREENTAAAALYRRYGFGDGESGTTLFLTKSL